MSAETDFMFEAVTRWLEKEAKEKKERTDAATGDDHQQPLETGTKEEADAAT